MSHMAAYSFIQFLMNFFNNTSHFTLPLAKPVLLVGERNIAKSVTITVPAVRLEIQDLQKKIVRI